MTGREVYIQCWIISYYNKFLTIIVSDFSSSIAYYISKIVRLS